MAHDKDSESHLRASDLKLLKSGIFADVTLTCGNRSWKLHKNILCSRSVWFERALTGGFKEATDGVIQIEEQAPEAVALILKYIYGGIAAVDQVKATCDRPVVKFCVDTYRAADFFLLEPMMPIIQRRLGDYCAQRLNFLSAPAATLVILRDKTVLSWTDDVVDGIREAYKWNVEPIKKMLMEFVWEGRASLLRTGPGPWVCLQDHLDEVPNFTIDMLSPCEISD